MAIRKEFWRLAWPAAAEGLLLMLLTAADLLMVSALGNTAVAAVSIFSQPRMVILCVTRSYSVALSAYVARRRGKHPDESLTSCSRASLMLGCGLSMLLLVGTWIGAGPLLRLAGAQDDYINLGLQYAFPTLVSLALSGPAKEGLFRAIAEPVVDQFKAMFRRVQEDFHQLSEEEQRADMGQYTARHQEEMLDYIYDHFDVFRLLLDGAHGTRFSCFLDELVDIEVEYTYKYMEVIGCESVKSGLVTEEFIHIIVTAYFNGMFEVVRHNMDRAAAHRYVKMLNRYHMAGFSTVFDPQP